MDNFSVLQTFTLKVYLFNTYEGCKFVSGGWWILTNHALNFFEGENFLLGTENYIIGNFTHIISCTRAYQLVWGFIHSIFFFVSTKAAFRPIVILKLSLKKNWKIFPAQIMFRDWKKAAAVIWNKILNLQFQFENLIILFLQTKAQIFWKSKRRRFNSSNKKPTNTFKHVQTRTFIICVYNFSSVWFEWLWKNIFL